MKITAATLSRLSRLPGFPETGRELMRVVGGSAAAALMAEWPGLEFPVPMVEGGGCAKGERRWAQLAEIVGEAAAQAIVRHYRGCRIYIPNLKSVRLAWMQSAAHKEYERLVLSPNNYSHDEAINEIALAAGMSSRSVERWLAKPAPAPEYRGQGTGDLRQLELPMIPVL